MKCKKCGTELDSKVKFCSTCGIKISEEKVKTQLKCKACGGMLEIDEERGLLICPYCESIEEIDEEDTVKIERIKSKAYKEVEFEKIRLEREKEKKEENIQQLNAFKNSKLSKILIVAFCISLICMFNCFSMRRIIAGLIAAIQAGLYVTSWLMGMQYIEETKPRMHRLLATIGFVMIILYSRAI